MTLDLTKDQKSKISLHGGYVLSTRYPDALPMWKEIGTDVKQALFQNLINRLREYECNDIAEKLESHRHEETLKLLQIRFKSIKDKRRAQAKQQAQLQEQKGVDPSLISSHRTILTINESQTV